MKLADGIRKHGFRKWYERELLQSHAHLLLCFLCVIGLFAAFEAAWRFEGGLDRLANLGAGLLCAATGLWALRRSGSEPPSALRRSNAYRIRSSPGPGLM